MSNNRKTSKLVAILAGAGIGAVAIGSNPTASINFTESTVQRGQESSYNIRLDASTFSGSPINGIRYFTETLPTSFQGITNHDIFSSIDDTSGTYLEGFLTGEQVSGGNVINDTDGIVGRVVTQDGPEMPNDKVIRYDFLVDSNAPLGQYNLGLLEGTRINYGAPPINNYFIPQQDLIPGSFTVIPNMQQFSADTQGPGVTVPGTNNDFDQDGDVDLGDWAEAQIRVSGQ